MIRISTLIILSTLTLPLYALECDDPGRTRSPLSLLLLSMRACMQHMCSSAGEHDVGFIEKYVTYISKDITLHKSVALTPQEKLRLFPCGARTDHIGGQGLAGVTLAGNGEYVIGHDTCNIDGEHCHIIARVKANGTPEAFREIQQTIPYQPPLLLNRHTAEYLTWEQETPFSRIRALADLGTPENTLPPLTSAKKLAQFALRDKSSGYTWWFRNNGKELCHHHMRHSQMIFAYEEPYAKTQMLYVLPEQASIFEIGADGDTLIYVPDHINIVNNTHYVIQQSALRVLNINAFTSEKKDPGILIPIDQSNIQNPHIWSIAVNTQCTQYACGLTHAMYVFTKGEPFDKPLLFTYRNVPWARWHGNHRDSRAIVQYIAFHEEPYIISCTQDCICIHDKNQPGPAIKYIQTPCEHLSLSFDYDSNHLAIGHVGGDISLVPFLNDTALTDIQRMLLRIAYDGILNNPRKYLFMPCLEQLPERIQHLLLQWRAQCELLYETRAIMQGLCL